MIAAMLALVDPGNEVVIERTVEDVRYHGLAAGVLPAKITVGIRRAPDFLTVARRIPCKLPAPR